MGPLALRAAVVTEAPVSLTFATAPVPLAEREVLLAVACEPEPFDLLLLCPLREADLLVAISHSRFG
jgi:hypothetical protein